MHHACEDPPGSKRGRVAGLGPGVESWPHGYNRDGFDRQEACMPPNAWSEKRERQYEHIKEGLEERGQSEDTAEEIAARTVNKERARHGEAATASRTSTDDISSSRRGGLRSHRGPGGRTKEQLYNEARQRNIAGRSRMSKAELERAVGR
jgi:plasmid stabilization system protein ParE